MDAVLFRTPYNHDPKEFSDMFSYVETQGSLTVQSQALDADINEIVRRVGIGHPMPQSPRVPSYGDFTGVTDFASAVNAVNAAMDGFMELPAAVRARFRNDPQMLLEFCANDANIPEARALGLLKEQVNGNSGVGSGVDSVSGGSAQAAGAVAQGNGGSAAGG